MNMKALLQDIKEDLVFKKYQAVVATVQGSLDPEKIKAEALFLHKTRPSRELFREKMSPVKTNDAILRDLSNRARLVELRVNLALQVDLLTTTLSSLKDHLLTAFGDEIKEVASNAELRSALMHKVTARGRTLKAEYETVLALLDKLIEDIDKAGFSLRNSMELIKVLTERPGQLV